ncbi:MAG: nucleotide sugar dehydrogenase [Actinomycetota bacterium]|nr:nucleotide sugar dehydrogenase [Actinomycetota bacterium]
MQILEAITTRQARVAVIGLGYVGLPLALRLAETGFDVAGLDTNPRRVDELLKRHSPLLEIPDDELEAQISSGRFRPTTDPAVLSESDIILICVPTPLKQDLPDMSSIEAAAETVALHLHPGQLVILESTTYPGTTEEFLLKILESSGLKAGLDFYLGFSPERIDPGNDTYHLANVPKIVGGIDDPTTELMAVFYGTFVERVVRVSSPRTAEMAKLLENTYRHVNIALVNEMAILCHDLGIDVWEVIEAAKTKPFGFHAFYPGPGWGGHCIPVDPAYLSWRVRQIGATARFVELAREFNQRMPAYIVQRMAEALNDRDKSLKGSSVLVLGVAYKPDIADARESPAIDIIERLVRSGARVAFHDPHVGSIRLKDREMHSSDLTDETLGSADIVLMHTNHSAYRPEWIAEYSRLILDTRNCLSQVRGNIIKL